MKTKFEIANLQLGKNSLYQKQIRISHLNEMDVQNSLKNWTFSMESFHCFSEKLQIIPQNVRMSVESLVKESTSLEIAGACTILLCVLYIILKWATSELNQFDVV